MAKKFYTIMVIPHARAKFRRLSVSRNLLIVAGGFVALLVVAGLMSPHFALKAARLGTQLEQTVRENADLRQTNERFDASLNQLREELAEIESKATKFAMMVGVEDVPAQQLAAGGATFGLPGNPRVDADTIIEGEISTLRERSEALRESFQALDTEFQKQSLLLTSTPSIFPVRGLLGNGYGWRRDPFTGMRDFHQGLDIIAPLGTKVVAPADGIVTRVGPAGGFGNSVFISHGYGIVTRYAHLASSNVKVGQRIKRGDFIATLGNTGRSTGPHLHYEVLVHQRHVNPVKYILEEYKSF